MTSNITFTNYSKLDMDATIPQEAEDMESPKDLREKLFQDLLTEFAAALDSDGSLPAAAQKALVGLLTSDVPTVDEIIEAASKNDPSQEESTDE